MKLWDLARQLVKILPENFLDGPNGSRLICLVVLAVAFLLSCLGIWLEYLFILACFGKLNKNKKVLRGEIRELTLNWTHGHQNC